MVAAKRAPKSGSEQPDAMEAMKPLVVSLGWEPAKRMVDLLGQAEREAPMLSDRDSANAFSLPDTMEYRQNAETRRNRQSMHNLQ